MGQLRQYALRPTIGWGGVCLALLGGCEAPDRTVRYPEGALLVRFEAATSHSTCLVASVAMAANFVLGEARFSEPLITRELKATGRNETRVGDLKEYLAEKGLYLVTLAGKTGNRPPEGLGYWVRQRAYPVICVINRDETADVAFNHAVVVIGISGKPDVESADIIHYFDPSIPKPLQSSEAAAFETLWARGEYAMMIVVAPPPDSRPESAGMPMENH